MILFLAAGRGAESGPEKRRSGVAGVFLAVAAGRVARFDYGVWWLFVTLSSL